MSSFDHNFQIFHLRQVSALSNSYYLGDPLILCSSIFQLPKFDLTKWAPQILLQKMTYATCKACTFSQKNIRILSIFHQHVATVEKTLSLSTTPND